MNLRHGAIALVLLVVLVIAGFAAAAGDDGQDGDEQGGPAAEQDFVGLSLEDASALAESQGRPWRVSREDDTDFMLTMDLVPGRVTFEVDAGIVTAAVIEQADTGLAPGDVADEDPARAELVAAAVQRLLTIDNSFGGADVFDDIRVARTVGATGSALAPLDLELVADVLSGSVQVQFVDDADAEIAALFDSSPAGVAVVSVERIDLLDDRAEVEMRLWCGSLCGVFLTYEAIPAGDGWEITGTVGPIAVS